MCTTHCVKSAGGPTDYLQDFISFNFISYFDWIYWIFQQTDLNIYFTYIYYLRTLNINVSTSLPNRGVNTIMSSDLLTQCQQKVVNPGEVSRCLLARSVAAWRLCSGRSEHWQVKILFSCKFELKGSICLFPIFYPMSIPSTHCPDRARPTANTPAQSSYYYNLLAYYYVLLLNIIISINVFM